MALPRRGSDERRHYLNALIVKTLRSYIRGLTYEGGQVKEHKAARTAVLTGIAGPEIISNRLTSEVARLLGVKPVHLRQAAPRHLRLLAREVARADAPYRAVIRRDAVSAETLEHIRAFWLREAKSSPHAKDVIWVKVTSGFEDGPRYTRVSKAFVEESYRSLHYKFLLTHPSKHAVSYGAFFRAKPPQVRPLQVIQRRVCVCATCVNFRNLVAAVNKYRKLVSASLPRKRIQQRHWLPSQLTVETLIGAAFCPSDSPDALLPPSACLRGECNSCGIHLLEWKRFWPDEPGGDANPVISYERLMRAPADHPRAGVEIPVLVKLGLSEAVEAVISGFPAFAPHHLGKVWQREAWHAASDPECQRGHELITSSDFSEKLKLEFNNQTQGYYRNGITMPILVVVTYLVIAGAEQEVETHFFLCDDGTQDWAYVEAAHKVLLEHLRQRHPEYVDGLRVWFRWSDNCAAQFKCAAGFWQLSTWPDATGLRVQQDFFKAGHGKQVADEEGGLLKRLVQDELKRPSGSPLSTVQEVLAFLRRRHSEPASQMPLADNRDTARIKRRFFHELPVADVQAVRAALTCVPRPIPESLKQHSVRACEESGTVLARERSCYCEHCRHDAAGIDVGVTSCINSEHVGGWTKCHLVDAVADTDVETEAGTDPEAECEEMLNGLVRAISKGQVVAVVNDVPTQFPTYDYFLMKVSNAGELEEGWTDAEGAVFDAGEYVVRGRWLWHISEQEPLELEVGGGRRLVGAKLDSVLSMRVEVKPSDRPDVVPGRHFCITQATHNLLTGLAAGR